MTISRIDGLNSATLSQSQGLRPGPARFVAVSKTIFWDDGMSQASKPECALHPQHTIDAGLSVKRSPGARLLRVDRMAFAASMMAWGQSAGGTDCTSGPCLFQIGSQGFTIRLIGRLRLLTRLA